MKDSRIASKNLNGLQRPPIQSLSPPAPAATARFDKAAEQRPEDVAFQVSLASTAFHNGQYAIFDKALRRALEINPRYVPALELLANLNLAHGNMAALADICHKILKLDANNVDAMVGLGVFFFHQSNTDMARKSFERVLKLRPNHPPALEHLQSLQLAEPSSGSPKRRGRS